MRELTKQEMVGISGGLLGVAAIPGALMFMMSATFGGLAVLTLPLLATPLPLLCAATSILTAGAGAAFIGISLLVPFI